MTRWLLPSHFAPSSLSLTHFTRMLVGFLICIFLMFQFAWFSSLKTKKIKTWKIQCFSLLKSYEGILLSGLSCGSFEILTDSCFPHFLAWLRANLYKIEYKEEKEGWWEAKGEKNICIYEDLGTEVAAAPPDAVVVGWASSSANFSDGMADPVSYVNSERDIEQVSSFPVFSHCFILFLLVPKGHFLV